MWDNVDNRDQRLERIAAYMQEPEVAEIINQVCEAEFVDIYLTDTSLTLDGAFRKARAKKAQRGAVERKRVRASQAARKASQRAAMAPGYGQVMF